MNTILSSKQVAEILGVNESSVKRWADSGMLSCYKTPGGHRKFKKEDLLLFSSKYSFELKSDLNNNITERNNHNNINLKNTIDILLKKLMVSSEVDITDFLYSLHLFGVSVVELYDNVIAKTMHEVGEKWKHKELTIDQEHIATNKIVNSVIRLQDKIISMPYKGLTAICVSLEGEFHELPLLCVKNVLSYFGWKVIYLGTNTPVKAIQSSIVHYKPDVVCLSSTIIKNKESFISDIRKIYNVSKSSGSKLIIGGAGINKPDKPSVKHDAVINNSDELIKYLKLNFQF